MVNQQMIGLIDEVTKGSEWIRYVPSCQVLHMLLWASLAQCL